MTENHTNIPPTISACYGNVTGKSATGRIAIMIAKPIISDDKVDLDIVLPHTVIKTGRFPVKSPAASIHGSQQATYGEWSRTTYDSIPNGTLLVVQVSTTMGKAPYADGALLCRIRDTGPLYDVKVKLFNSTALGFDGNYVNVDTYTNDSGQYEVPVISGRFDIIGIDELEGIFGGQEVYIKQYYLDKYFNQEEIDELFNIRQLATEICTTRTKVASSGKVVEITSRKLANRKIKLVKGA